MLCTKIQQWYQSHPWLIQSNFISFLWFGLDPVQTISKSDFFDWCLLDVFDVFLFMINIIDPWSNLGYEILWVFDLYDKFLIRSYDLIFYGIVNPVHVMCAALEWYIGCTLPRLRVLAYDAFIQDSRADHHIIGHSSLWVIHYNYCPKVCVGPKKFDRGKDASDMD